MVLTRVEVSPGDWRDEDLADRAAQHARLRELVRGDRARLGQTIPVERWMALRWRRDGLPDTWHCPESTLRRGEDDCEGLARVAMCTPLPMRLRIEGGHTYPELPGIGPVDLSGAMELCAQGAALGGSGLSWVRRQAQSLARAVQEGVLPAALVAASPTVQAMLAARVAPELLAMLQAQAGQAPSVGAADDTAEIVAALDAAASALGAPREWVWTVARAESAMDPTQVTGSHVGLFQVPARYARAPERLTEPRHNAEEFARLLSPVVRAIGPGASLADAPDTWRVRGALIYWAWLAGTHDIRVIVQRYAAWRASPPHAATRWVDVVTQALPLSPPRVSEDERLAELRRSPEPWAPETIRQVASIMLPDDASARAAGLTATHWRSPGKAEYAARAYHWMRADPSALARHRATQGGGGGGVLLALAIAIALAASRG